MYVIVFTYVTELYQDFGFEMCDTVKHTFGDGIEYGLQSMLPKLIEKGFEIGEVNEVTTEDLKNYPSTWAKKLRFGQERRYFHIQLRTV